MAYKGKEIRNAKTGQHIRFVQTSKESNGELLEMISLYKGRTTMPPPHYHPHQDEYFEVLKGKLTVLVNGKLQSLRAGETLHIKRNTIHAMWNDTNDPTLFNWKVVPALNTEYFLETAIGLANDDKTNDAGKPCLLQVALMANKFVKVFRLSKPSFIIQRIIFCLLAPFAYVAGYKPTYQKYLD